MRFPEYAGMSYEQASRAASELLDQKNWFQEWDRLETLRDIMQCGVQLDRSSKSVSGQQDTFALEGGTYAGEAISAAMKVMKDKGYIPKSIGLTVVDGQVEQRWNASFY